MEAQAPKLPPADRAGELWIISFPGMQKCRTLPRLFISQICQYFFCDRDTNEALELYFEA